MLNENQLKFMCYCQFSMTKGETDLCKSGKEYLNALLCKFVVYSLQHSETFDVSHDFLPVTIAELPTLKHIRFFGLPCIINTLLQILCRVCQSKNFENRPIISDDIDKSKMPRFYGPRYIFHYTGSLFALDCLAVIAVVCSICYHIHVV